MTQFALYAILIIVATAALVLPSLWFGKRRRAVDADRKAANLAIFRDQLAELERERSEGSLAAEDYEQARSELQRRLLDEVDVADGDTAASPPTSRPTAIVLLLLLPIAAMGGYALLGNPAALDPVNTAPQKQMTAADIEGMVAKLAAKMQDNPDDMNGWVMLGRSYKMLGRYAEAVDAYAKAEAFIAQDPELLASYAETLAMASGKGLSGKARTLIDQALKLDPKHAHSLFLAGAAAMEAGDAKNGIAYWEALLPQVEAGSELDQMLRQGIEEMKKRGG
ncbi:c-type cytochrome biogenesis protein CcmI [Azonexus fungiphilus]|jgi:cytochrome c-type biogenesis protein CcmH|uniref:c-type cytochrome biogenesis protein CcmI n=1 Tax=Azonexus fungiphilus TaxID=146940 RepID=UPI00156B83C6|nr:c-type cytochrome biogenesis protein CcmI [Azonexus fungiphilus]NHC07940.1 c-type cytochrome biogenesis protein CcmI [Azonexus fungiphilus]